MFTGCISPAEKKFRSKIIRYLTQSEKQLLTDEIINNSNLSRKHVPFNSKEENKNVLRHGKSIYIYDFSRLGHIVEDKTSLFPNTMNFIFSCFPEFTIDNLGRTYWHTLQPGERIDCHHDNVDFYIKDIHRNQLKRYHIYLGIPFEAVVVMDGELRNVYAGDGISNTLIEFNHLDFHYYNNHSDIPISFLIFDFCKENIREKFNSDYINR